MANVKKAASKAAKKATVAVMASPEPDMRYRAEDALRTITRAAECRRDKDLMRHVKRLVKDQAKAVCK
jgi:hypothetical protein